MKYPSTVFLKSLRDFYDNYNLDVLLKDNYHSYSEEAVIRLSFKLQYWLLKLKDNQYYSFMKDLEHDNIFTIPDTYEPSDFEGLACTFLEHLIVNKYSSAYEIRREGSNQNKSITVVVQFS
jgi:hypothetical protein